jgi:dienelactone hydrolase
MRKMFLLSLITLIIMRLDAQKIITFPSIDNLPVTADFYESKSSEPYLLLFHQAGYSRGEYKETAEKFVKLGYNCLAVDLRSGDEVNYVKNKTTEAALERNLPTDYLDAKQDIQAAIEFAIKQSARPVIILGSSYSASLCLVLAKKYKQIKAVIAFSPGEYFSNPNYVRDSIEGLKIPIFVASSENEYSYMKELFSKIDQKNLTLFKPNKGLGVHGSKALWDNNKTSNEYWLALMLFISQLKY